MLLRFDVMLNFNLGNENSGAGHIKCLHGLQVPRHYFNVYYYSE